MLSYLVIALTIEVCGVVQDSLRVPVDMANVRIQATENSVSTDALGRFCINQAEPPMMLVASKERYLMSSHSVDTATTEELVFTLFSLPQNSEAYEWLASLHSEIRDHKPNQFQPCENCHSRLTSEWKNSAHANLEKESLFNTLLDSGQHQLPIEQCNLCHQPVVSDNSASIGCDFCHKVNKVDAQDSLLLGAQRLSLLTPLDSQVFFGPLDDVARDRDSYSSLYKSSEYCAGCHQGRFWKTNVYSDYSEWQASQFAIEGTQCQSCHMATEAVYAADPDKGGVLRKPETLSNHHFKITAQEITGAIKEHIEIISQKDSLHLSISLTNIGAGHKIPGGNPMRHLILKVDVRNRDGQPMKQLTGSRIPNWVRGDLPGTPGNAYGKVLVAQRNYQRQPSKKTIYPAPFWVNSYIESDNRLVPFTTITETLEFESVEGASINISLLLREHYEQWLDLGPAETTIVFSKELTL